MHRAPQEILGNKMIRAQFIGTVENSVENRDSPIFLKI